MADGVVSRVDTNGGKESTMEINVCQTSFAGSVNAL